MFKYLNFIIFLILTSCLGSKYPTGMSKWEGTVWNCRADSNTIKFDTVIKIKGTIEEKLGDKCINCKYTDCNINPDYFGSARHWPGLFTFKFKSKEYWFINNSRVYVPDPKSIQYDLDFGSVHFSKKKKTLTLNSTKYNVARIYSYEYSKQDSVLTLKLIK